MLFKNTAAFGDIERRRRIIKNNLFLRQIYQDWYKSAALCFGADKGLVLEIGSGAGFLREFLPGLITSDIISYAQLNLVLDGADLPFKNSALGGIAMINVFHHFSRPGRFLNEAIRCIRPGGVLFMIEPWVSAWSRFIYTYIHPEPFNPQAKYNDGCAADFCFANQALPWIIFSRDKLRFAEDFKQLRLRIIAPFMPFRYIISGGFSCPSLMPPGTYKFWSLLENRLGALNHRLACFAAIEILRI